MSGRVKTVSDVGYGMFDVGWRSAIKAAAAALDAKAQSYRDLASRLDADGEDQDAYEAYGWAKATEAAADMVRSLTRASEVPAPPTQER